MEIKKPPGIIVALDIPLQKASKLVRELEKVEDKIAGYKISSLQAMEAGLKAVVSELRLATKVPLIYDHQKGATDIPEISAQQVSVAAAAGVDSFIGVPLGAGGKTLESFVDACKKNKVEPIILLEMTHPGANDFLKENTAKEVFQQATALGVRYFVVPGTKPEKVKEYNNWRTGKEVYFVSPGFGAQGGQVTEGVKNGVDYPIVGRAVYGAEKPADVVNELYKECLEGWRLRK